VREIAVAAVSRICLREGHGTKGMDAEFALALLHYAWPGNVRELLNAIEHAVAKSRGHQVLLPIHLPTDLRANIAKSAMGADQRDPEPRLESAHSGSLASGEHTALQPLAAHRHADTQRYLETLIAIAGANVAEACRVSGLSRSRLYALLKEHGLSLR
jgi:two-component system NtrC family response regulator